VSQIGFWVERGGRGDVHQVLLKQEMMSMALSESTIRYARGTGKSYILNDTEGLALRVKARGSKLWHVRFTWGGKQCRMALGAYPALGLKDARNLRDEAQVLLAKGIDPRVHRRSERAAARVADVGMLA
jgi:hypothetical protein